MKHKKTHYKTQNNKQKKQNTKYKIYQNIKYNNPKHRKQNTHTHIQGKHANTESQKHKTPQTQKHTNTESQKNANTETQKHTQTQKNLNANTKTQKRKNTNTKTQTHKHKTHTQKHRITETHTRKHKHKNHTHTQTQNRRKTHTHTHTLTKTKASSAEVMKEDVPCFMMVKQTAWEKEIQPSWPMFQQDHHVNRNQIAGTWFQRPGIISLWLQKRLRWLETSESYSNPLLCVVTASKKKIDETKSHGGVNVNVEAQVKELLMVKVFSKTNHMFVMWKAQRPSTGFTSFEKVHTHTHPARRAGCSRQLFDQNCPSVIDPGFFESCIKQCPKMFARKLKRLSL